MQKQLFLLIIFLASLQASAAPSTFTEYYPHQSNDLLIEASSISIGLLVGGLTAYKRTTPKIKYFTLLLLSGTLAADVLSNSAWLTLPASVAFVGTALATRALQEPPIQ